MSAAPGSAAANEQDPARDGPGDARNGPSTQRTGGIHNAFLPVLILALALLAWSGFQTVMLVGESQTLTGARDDQEKQMQSANRIRQALDAVARDTATLAERGNPNARLIVEELRKRGVTINPQAPPVAK